MMMVIVICVYMFACVFAFFLRSAWQFWVLAFLVSTSQGGIQALSRSMFGKMIPDRSRSGEFFGFYDIFGKFSAIMGPALVGFVIGVALGIVFLKKGFTLRRSYDTPKAEGTVLPLVLTGIFIWKRR